MKKKAIVIVSLIMVCIIGGFSRTTSFKKMSAKVHNVFSSTENNLSETIPSRFDLRDVIGEISVKNQHAFEICIVCAKSTMFETHVKLKKNKRRV